MQAVGHQRFTQTPGKACKCTIHTFKKKLFLDIIKSYVLNSPQIEFQSTSYGLYVHVSGIEIYIRWTLWIYRERRTDKYKVRNREREINGLPQTVVTVVEYVSGIL